jgi:hypothetical protein
MAAQSKASGAIALKRQLERNRAARSSGDARNRDPRLKQLQAWQAARLQRDYAEVRLVPKNRLACDFFLNELYGDADFARRDQDVERIYPIMVKVLPGQVLGTVSRAVELNALSHELDLAMLSHLPATGDFSDAEYAAAYRASVVNGQRRYQLALVLSLGRELARVVKIPLMYRLLQMCRWPAKMAGLGALQLFLERGFAAFVALDGARPFLGEIRRREVGFLQRCLAAFAERATA